jgi:hypothetical protein
MIIACVLAASSLAQESPNTPPARPERKAEPGAGRQVANGAGNIGAGAAKGAGHLAVGTAKGVADLATLHPVDAAVSVGKGAGAAGKDVTVGTAKGGYKMTKGIARGIKKLF